MARKSREEAEQTRRRLLDVALEVFDEKGYSATTLQQIAERAGFTRGAVYWHFQNKADLFAALAADVEAGGDEIFGDGAVETREDLSRPLCAYLDHLESDPRVGTFYRVAYYRTEWSEELEPVLARHRKDMRELATWMVEGFRRLRTLGRVSRSRDPGRDGLALYVYFTGLLTVWVTEPGTLSMTRDAPALIEAFLDGLEPSAAGGASR